MIPVTNHKHKIKQIKKCVLESEQIKGTYMKPARKQQQQNDCADSA